MAVIGYLYPPSARGNQPALKQRRARLLVGPGSFSALDNLTKIASPWLLSLTGVLGGKA